jgi:hypothetical protein
MILFRLIALAVALLAAPALAAPKPEELAAAKEAEARGAEMYAYDQAAWHATDRFLADLERRHADQSALRGYVVEPDTDGFLKATFFAERDGRMAAFASYWVRGSKVVRGGLVEADGARELSLLAQRMVEVRTRAIAAMQQPGHGTCNRASPNSLVLPPRADGSIPVYIMTPQVSDGSYPAGGHYRFDFDARNRLIGERPFMKTCFDVRYGGTGEGRPVAVAVTHLLDPQPTEVHVFVSRYVPIGLLVHTMTNDTTWALLDGKIEPVEPDSKR